MTTLDSFQAKVSLDRVNKYMNNEELSAEAVSHDTSEKDPIVIRQGTFKWEAGEKTILDVSFNYGTAN